MGAQALYGTFYQAVPEDSIPGIIHLGLCAIMTGAR